MKGNVHELDVDEHEEILERVAAIDVAKASAKVCTRLPHASVARRRVTTVWDVGATTNSIMALADELAEANIERVVVESTSDYWRPFFYLLEARGLTVWLVNARDVKQVPGRPKTDKLDAVWLAKLNERGMLRPSFVPPQEIRQLRDYTRLRVGSDPGANPVRARLEKLLEDALIKLSSVVSELLGKSSRDMIEALIAGERDPKVLAKLAYCNMKTKHAALVEALTGRFDDHHAELARILLDQIDALSDKIDCLTDRVEQLIDAIPAARAPEATVDSDMPGDLVDLTRIPLPAVERLDEITGIGVVPPRPLSQKSASTWASSRPPATSSRGPRSRHAPSSPAPRAARARPARATPTSKGSWVRPLPAAVQERTLSWVSATGASSSVAAS